MRRSKNRRILCGYIWRFSFVHIITYLVFGLIFMWLSGYFSYFASHDLLKDYMRSSDSIIVRLAVPIQFLRGALIGLALFPFREIYISTKNGWLKLFGVLWVLTGVGAVITGPGSIEGFIYTKFGFGNPLISFPEITLQMLAFSYLFCRWEGKHSNFRLKYYQDVRF